MHIWQPTSSSSLYDNNLRSTSWDLTHADIFGAASKWFSFWTSWSFVICSHFIAFNEHFSMSTAIQVMKSFSTEMQTWWITVRTLVGWNNIEMLITKWTYITIWNPDLSSSPLCVDIPWTVLSYGKHPKQQHFWLQSTGLGKDVSMSSEMNLAPTRKGSWIDSKHLSLFLFKNSSMNWNWRYQYCRSWQLLGTFIW